MPADSVKYFRYERGYHMPSTLISKEEYEDGIKGCSKGPFQCEAEYKKNMKHARSQFKLGNAAHTDENGRMIRPPMCKICAFARDFSKTCDIQYENHFYGYAKEKETSKTIFFHWSNNWHPNFGISKTAKDGNLLPIGVRDKKAHDELFSLSVKPDNQKVSTPKVDEFISGYISENTNGPYRGKLQWVKWFRHSLTFSTWTKLVRTAIDNKSMQAMVNQPKLMIAKMIYDQNKLIPEMDQSPKTPCNCETISHEHWILASITMVAFLGIRPHDRNAFESFGGMSKVGELDFFTFLENIDKAETLFELTMKPKEVKEISPLRMHSSDFSRTIHDDSFWESVSNSFRSLPFNRVDRHFCQGSRRNVDYSNYQDNQSIEYLPYYNSVPYYNSLHAYDPRRYYGNDFYFQNHEYYHDHYNDPNRLFAHNYEYREAPYENTSVESYGSRKRSNSSSSRLSSHSLERGLRKYARLDPSSSPRRRSRHRSPRNVREYTAEDLRSLIMADRRQSERNRIEKKEEKRKRMDREKMPTRLRRRKEEFTPPRRCRDDSGREDNGRRSVSPSCLVSPRNKYPSYEDLVEKVRSMEKEREDDKKLLQKQKWSDMNSSSDSSSSSSSDD